MKQKDLVLFGVSALISVAIACSSSNPATPVAPAATGPAAASDGSTLKASAPTVQSPGNGQKLQSTTVVLPAGPSTTTFAAGVPLQYRFQVMNGAGTIVAQALVGTPSWTVNTTLAPNATHSWRVRSEYLGEAGPWSATLTFVSADPALINDPLTNGTPVGQQIGGRFVAGGWQSNSFTHAINWDVPTGGSWPLRSHVRTFV